jgi:4-amino-4-deoxy-L-arabinose transferase-like glycosyltransferase
MPNALSSKRFPLLLFSLALFIRLAWVYAFTPIIGIEGAEYVRMAQNLRAGNGLVGTMEGPQLMHSPLYPVLIAAGSFVLPNPELVAHLLAAVSGAGLVVLVRSLALRMYGARTAVLAALFAALHPLLVGFSASIYAESIYVTLLFAAIYWGIRAVDERRTADCLLAGVLFGLAYLTRPDAFVYPFFFALAMWLVGGWQKAGAVKLFRASLLMLVPHLLLAAPYVAYLHRHTGLVRLEGKWNINYTIGERIRSGMNLFDAMFGTNEKLEDEGPLLNPNRFIGWTPHPHSFADKLGYLFRNAKRNRVEVYQDVLLSSSNGSPILWILVILGLFRGVWTRNRLIEEALLSAMGFAIVFLVLTAHIPLFRYAFPITPILLLWAAHGLSELWQWALDVGRSVADNSWLPKAAAWGVSSVAVLLLWAFSLWGVQFVGEFTQEGPHLQQIRIAGLWLRDHAPGPKHIFSLGTVLPYYAEGTFLPFPHAPAPLTLRYIESRNPDYVALLGRYSSYYPTVAEWIEHDIPDRRAELVYDSGPQSVHRIKIYRWHRESRQK